MRIKLVRENIMESIGVGAGFSMSRVGFGGGSNLGSKTTMYTYDIKPLNRSLETKPPASSFVQLPYSIGSRVSGTVLSPSLDFSKKIKGIVRSIKKSEIGTIKYLSLIHI